MVLDDEQPLLGPNGQWQGQTVTTAAAAGRGMVVVSGRNVDGTMFGSRWLPNIAIINNQPLNY
jgi:hypothetical protein